MTGKFRSDTAIYGLAQVAERLLSFFLLPLLTKATSAQEYGIWSQLIVVAGISTPIALLGLQTAMVRYLPSWRDAMQVRYSMVLSAFIAVTGVVVALTIGLVLFRDELSLVFFGISQHSVFVLLLAGFVATEVMFELLVSVLRADGLIRRIACYLLLKSAARIGVFLYVLAYLGGTFQVAVLSFVLSQFCFVFLLILREVPIRSVAKAGLKPSRPYWGETLRFALPMVVLALLTGLNNSVDRFFLTHLLGVHEVAVYAAAYSLAGIAGFFYSVLGFTLFPAMSACWADGKKDVAAQLLDKSIQVYLFLLLPFAVVLSLCGPDALVLLTTNQYQANSWLFFFSVAAIGLFGIYQVTVFAVILGGKNVEMMLSMVISIAINVFFAALLVPRYGVVGAAAASCFANGALVVRTIASAKNIVEMRNFGKNLFPILIRTGFLYVFTYSLKSIVDLGNLKNLLCVLIFTAVIYFVMDFYGRNSTLRYLTSFR